jgi:polyhydroxybutyrate depolymerase
MNVKYISAAFLMLTACQVDPKSGLEDEGVINATLEPGINEWAIAQEIDGDLYYRFATVHAPPDIGKYRYPVMFALHGNGGSMDDFMDSVGPMVEAGNYVAVYPQGVENSWNLGLEDSTADDVAFLEFIIDKLNSYNTINSDRIYVQGVSNGGGMSQLMGVQSDKVRGIAPMSTALIDTMLPIDIDNSLSVIQIHGMEDDLCPYDGSPSPIGHDFLAAEDSIQYWADHNGCNTEAQQSETEDGNLQLRFSQCDSGVNVIHYGIAGAGHDFSPNTEGGLQRLIWDFFRE